MSNYLAIATVTATLKRILQSTIQADLSGAIVTTLRPDAQASAMPEKGVNIYLYQACPNPAWRNSDLKTRRPKGDLAKRAQAGLDLYYLMSFYGDESEFEPQRLLGSTVRTLIDQPILTPEIIRETIQHQSFPYLQDSTLADQVERVTMVPSFISTEELSKIWSVFFQTPYTLSFAYQGSAVLIEGDRPGSSIIPVRSRPQVYTTPNQPWLRRIRIDVEDEEATSSLGDVVAQPVLSSRLLLEGGQLISARTQIAIGEAIITPAPQDIQNHQIRLHLASLPAHERRNLRPGIQGVQVLHPAQHGGSSSSRFLTIASNTQPFVLHPTINRNSVAAINLSSDDDELYSGQITLSLDLEVAPSQRVFLLLNQRVLQNSMSYVFAANSRTSTTAQLSFTIRQVQAGSYLIRVQVDGAESLLERDDDLNSTTYEQFTNPCVEITYRGDRD